MKLKISGKSNKIGIIDVADKDLLELRWHLSAGYATRALPKTRGDLVNRTIRAHRVIALRMFGDISGIQVDHINGNRLDNRRKNLRLAPNNSNCFNSKLRYNSKIGFKGVQKDKRLPASSAWFAVITVDGHAKYLGYYGNAIDAAHRYDEAARKYFKEFACVNFPKKGERGCLV